MSEQLNKNDDIYSSQSSSFQASDHSSSFYTADEKSNFSSSQSSQGETICSQDTWSEEPSTFNESGSEWNPSQYTTCTEEKSTQTSQGSSCWESDYPSTLCENNNGYWTIVVHDNSSSYDSSQGSQNSF
jgi:hypothetical protein